LEEFTPNCFQSTHTSTYFHKNRFGWHYLWYLHDFGNNQAQPYYLNTNAKFNQLIHFLSYAHTEREETTAEHGKKELESIPAKTWLGRSHFFYGKRNHYLAVWRMGASKIGL